MIKKSIILLLVLCPALLSARTWTAKDGRTVEGDYVIASDDSVVVALKGGGTVTIPLSTLSDVDVAYVRESEGQQPANVAKNAPAFPKLCGPDDTDENDRQLEEKYEKLAHMLSDGVSPRSIKLFKAALAQDRAYWKHEASYNSTTTAATALAAKNAPPSKSKAKTAAEAQTELAANKNTARIQARVTWLTKTLPNWLHVVIKDAGTP